MTTSHSNLQSTLATFSWTKIERYQLSLCWRAKRRWGQQANAGTKTMITFQKQQQWNNSNSSGPCTLAMCKLRREGTHERELETGKSSESKLSLSRWGKGGLALDDEGDTKVKIRSSYLSREQPRRERKSLDKLTNSKKWFSDCGELPFKASVPSLRMRWNLAEIKLSEGRHWLIREILIEGYAQLFLQTPGTVLHNPWAA